MINKVINPSSASYTGRKTKREDIWKQNTIYNDPALVIKTTSVFEQILLEEHKMNKLIFFMGKTKAVKKRLNLLFNCGFDGKHVDGGTCTGSLE